MKDKKVCQVHGGKTPKKSVKNPRHSNNLPTRLAERYNAALEDEDLLNLSHEVALIDAILGEKLATLDAAESAAGWQRAYDLFREAIRKGPEGKDSIEELGKVLRAGMGEAVKMREISDLVEQRRRLTESEVKRMGQLQQFITASQANALLAAVIHIIKENIQDRGVLIKVQGAIAALAHRGETEL